LGCLLFCNFFLHFLSCAWQWCSLERVARPNPIIPASSLPLFTVKFTCYTISSISSFAMNRRAACDGAQNASSPCRRKFVGHLIPEVSSSLVTQVAYAVKNGTVAGRMVPACPCLSLGDVSDIFSATNDTPFLTKCTKN
jgi:hypothetical protein